MADRSAGRASVRLRETGPSTYALSGALGFDSVGAALRQGAAMFFAGASPVLDLSEVTHADSAGLALLIHWMRKARSQGREIVFRDIPPQMWAIARTTGVDGFLAPRDG